MPPLNLPVRRDTLQNIFEPVLSDSRHCAHSSNMAPTTGLGCSSSHVMDLSKKIYFQCLGFGEARLEFNNKLTQFLPNFSTIQKGHDDLI